MQKVKVGNTSKKICSSSPREGRRLSPLSPSPRGRKLHVCLREHPPPIPFPPPSRFPAPGRSPGWGNPPGLGPAPPPRPAAPQPPTPHPALLSGAHACWAWGAGRVLRGAPGLRGARSSCRCGYVGSASGILPAGAEQNSMGGAAAAAGPPPGGLRRLRLGLVGAGKDLVGAGRESVRDPPARRGVPGVGRGLALPPPPAGTLLKNEWGGRGHGGNFSY